MYIARRICTSIVAAAALLSAGAAHADSVFKTDGSAKSMFADRRARAVGDVVTVMITETTVAQQDAATNIQNKVAASADGGSGLFGLLKAVPKASLGGSVAHQGSGTTTRSSNLTTTITCRISGINANGLLQLTGDRTVKVNADTQVIRFSGVARPDDVGINNSIASSQVADAKIEVIGKGPLDRHTRPGLLTGLIQLLVGGG